MDIPHTRSPMDTTAPATSVDGDDNEGMFKQHMQEISVSAPPIPHKQPYHHQPSNNDDKISHQLGYAQFKPSDINDNDNILIIGKRNTGKSTLLCDILYHHRHIPWGVACSPTECANSFLCNFIPKPFIHTEPEECDALTTKVINFQQQRVGQVGKELLEPCFIVYDDVMYDNQFTKQKSTRKLFMNGRHYKIFSVLTAQYCMDIPPALRSNVDFVFILKDGIRANKERLYDAFAGFFNNKHDFMKAMDAITKDHRAMVIMNNVNSSDPIDCVRWYKATPDIEFRMGSEAYWQAADGIQQQL